MTGTRNTRRRRGKSISVDAKRSTRAEKSLKEPGNAWSKLKFLFVPPRN